MALLGPQGDEALVQLAGRVVQAVMRDSLAIVCQGKGQHALTGGDPMHYQLYFFSLLLGNQMLLAYRNQHVSIEKWGDLEELYSSENDSCEESQVVDSEKYNFFIKNQNAREQGKFGAVNSSHSQFNPKKNPGFKKKFRGGLRDAGVPSGFIAPEAIGAATGDGGEQEAGASDQTGDFVTVQMNPITLYHGQSESGVMKVKFSIVSSVRRRIMTNSGSAHGPSEDSSIEEIYAAVSDPVVQNFEADCPSLEQSNLSRTENISESCSQQVIIREHKRKDKEYSDNHQHIDAKQQGRSCAVVRGEIPLPQVDPPTQNTIEIVRPTTKPSASHVYKKKPADIERKIFHGSPRMEELQLQQVDPPFLPRVEMPCLILNPLSCSDISESIKKEPNHKPEINQNNSPIQVEMNTHKPSDSSGIQISPNDLKKNVLHQPIETAQKQLPFPQSDILDKAKLQTPVNTSPQLSLPKVDVSTPLILSKLNEQWKSQENKIPDPPGVDAVEDIPFADSDVNDICPKSFFLSSEKPKHYEEPNQVSKAAMGRNVLSLSRLSGRTRYIKSRKRLKKQLNRPSVPLSPVKEEFGDSIDEIEEMAAIYEDSNDSFEQLLASAEDSLLISPGNSSCNSNPTLDLSAFIGSAPLATGDEDDDLDQILPLEITDPPVKEMQVMLNSQLLDPETCCSNINVSSTNHFQTKQLEDETNMSSSSDNISDFESAENSSQSREDKESLTSDTDIEDSDGKDTCSKKSETAQILQTLPIADLEAEEQEDTPEHIDTKSLSLLNVIPTPPADIYELCKEKETDIDNFDEDKKTDDESMQTPISKTVQPIRFVDNMFVDLEFHPKTADMNVADHADSLVQKRDKKKYSLPEMESNSWIDHREENERESNLWWGKPLQTSSPKLDRIKLKPAVELNSQNLEKLNKKESTISLELPSSKLMTRCENKFAENDGCSDEEKQNKVLPLETMKFKINKEKKNCESLTSHLKESEMVDFSLCQHAGTPERKQESDVNDVKNDQIPGLQPSELLDDGRDESYMGKRNVNQVLEKEGTMFMGDEWNISNGESAKENKLLNGASKLPNRDDVVDKDTTNHLLKIDAHKKETAIDDAFDNDAPSYLYEVNTYPKKEMAIDDALDNDASSHLSKDNAHYRNGTVIDDASSHLQEVNENHKREMIIDNTSYHSFKSKIKETTFLKTKPISDSHSLNRSEQTTSNLKINTQIEIEQMIERQGKESPKLIHLDKYHLKKHDEMMELSSSRSVFKAPPTPPSMVVFPLTSDSLPPLPDTTDVPSISDTEGRQRLEQQMQQERAQSLHDPNQVWQDSYDNNVQIPILGHPDRDRSLAGRKRWVPKRNRERRRANQPLDKEEEDVSASVIGTSNIGRPDERSQLNRTRESQGFSRSRHHENIIKTEKMNKLVDELKHIQNLQLQRDNARQNQDQKKASEHFKDLKREKDEKMPAIVSSQHFKSKEKQSKEEPDREKHNEIGLEGPRKEMEVQKGRKDTLEDTNDQYREGKEKRGSVNDLQYRHKEINQGHSDNKERDKNTERRHRDDEDREEASRRRHRNNEDREEASRRRHRDDEDKEEASRRRHRDHEDRKEASRQRHGYDEDRECAGRQRHRDDEDREEAGRQRHRDDEDRQQTSRRRHRDDEDREEASRRRHRDHEDREEASRRRHRDHEDREEASRQRHRDDEDREEASRRRHRDYKERERNHRRRHKNDEFREEDERQKYRDIEERDQSQTMKNDCERDQEGRKRYRDVKEESKEKLGRHVDESLNNERMIGKRKVGNNRTKPEYDSDDDKYDRDRYNRKAKNNRGKDRYMYSEERTERCGEECENEDNEYKKDLCTTKFEKKSHDEFDSENKGNFDSGQEMSNADRNLEYNCHVPSICVTEKDDPVNGYSREIDETMKPHVVAVDRFLNSVHDVDRSSSPRLSKRRGGAIASSKSSDKKKKPREKNRNSLGVPIPGNGQISNLHAAVLTRSNTSLASSTLSKRSRSESPRIFENSPECLPPRPQIDPLTGEPFYFVHPLMAHSMDSLRSLEHKPDDCEHSTSDGHSRESRQKIRDISADKVSDAVKTDMKLFQEKKLNESLIPHGNKKSQLVEERQVEKDVQRTWKPRNTNDSSRKIKELGNKEHPSKVSGFQNVSSRVEEICSNKPQEKWKATGEGMSRYKPVEETYQEKEPRKTESKEERMSAHEGTSMRVYKDDELKHDTVRTWQPEQGRQIRRGVWKSVEPELEDTQKAKLQPSDTVNKAKPRKREESFEDCLLPTDPTNFTIGHEDFKPDLEEQIFLSQKNKKGLLNRLSCIGGKSKETAKRAEKAKGKSPVSRQVDYFEEGEKKKIKKVSKDKDKEEKGLWYFQNEEDNMQNTEADTKSSNDKFENEDGDNNEPIFNTYHPIYKYEKRHDSGDQRYLSTFSDPVPTIDPFLEEKENLSGSLQIWNSGRMTPVLEESSVSSFKSSKKEGSEHSVLRSFGKGEKTREEVSKFDYKIGIRKKEDTNNNTDYIDPHIMHSNESINKNKDETPQLKCWEPCSDIGKSYDWQPKPCESLEVSVESAVQNDVPEDLDTYSYALNNSGGNADHLAQVEHHFHIDTNESFDLTKDDSGKLDQTALPLSLKKIKNPSKVTPAPHMKEESSSGFNELESTTLRTAQEIRGLGRPHKNVFGPAYGENETSFEPSMSFDSADYPVRSKNRAFSFDESYNRHGENPPFDVGAVQGAAMGIKRRISIVSTDSNSLRGGRSRSSSTTSNPLTYEPWRAKAKRRSHSMSISEIMTVRGAPRNFTHPHRSRSRSFSEIPHAYSSTVANSSARRRSRTQSPQELSPRIYQPRQRSRSRGSLGDTSLGCGAAPVTQHSFDSPECGHHPPSNTGALSAGNTFLVSSQNKSLPST